MPPDFPPQGSSPEQFAEYFLGRFHELTELQRSDADIRVIYQCAHREYHQKLFRYLDKEVSSLAEDGIPDFMKILESNIRRFLATNDVFARIAGESEGDE